MGRAIGADGVAHRARRAPFGGSPTTTYAENIGVMAATRVYSTAAYYVAAVVAILLGLCPKFGAIVTATPGGVLGGITVVLYGMIGLLGAKIWSRTASTSPTRSTSWPRRRAHHRHRRRHPGDHRRLLAGGIALGTIMVIVFFHLVNPHRAAAASPGTMGARWPTVEAVTPARETSAVRLLPARVARPRRWRPWPVRRGPRCWPAARAWSRCCPCGWPRPRCSSTSTGCPASTPSPPTSPASRIGALARHADVLAVGRSTPGAAAGHDGARDVAHATIRNRGTTVGSLVHADAAAEMPVSSPLLGGSLEVEGAGRAPHRPRRRALRRPARVSLHHAEIAVSAFFPALAAGAGVAFDEIARRHGDYALWARPRSSRATRSGSATSRCPTSRPSSTSPAYPTTGSARSRWSSFEPDDDIHATADYREEPVRVLTARVVRSARGEGAAHERGAARRPY